MKGSFLHPFFHLLRKRRLVPWTVTGMWCIVLLVPAFSNAASGDSTATAESGNGYRIEQPGTITFTVGVKISGKVEKPQVMIFLPKEKTLYRNEVPRRSFYNELIQPLPFTPLSE